MKEQSTRATLNPKTENRLSRNVVQIGSILLLMMIGFWGMQQEQTERSMSLPQPDHSNREPQLEEVLPTPSPVLIPLEVSAQEDRSDRLAPNKKTTLTSQFLVSNLSAHTQHPYVVLHWQVDTSLHIEGYVIERSFDRVYFQSLDTLVLPSDTHQAFPKEWIDHGAFEQELPRLTYRICALGADGQKHYSQTITTALDLNLGIYAKWVNPPAADPYLLLASDLPQDTFQLALNDPTGLVLMVDTIAIGRKPITYPILSLSAFPPQRQHYQLSIQGTQKAMQKPVLW